MHLKTENKIRKKEIEKMSRLLKYENEKREKGGAILPSWHKLHVTNCFLDEHDMRMRFKRPYVKAG